MTLTSVAKNFLVAGHMETADIVAHMVFGGLALAAVLVRSEVFHRIMAPASLLLLLTYTGLLFADLGRFG